MNKSKIRILYRHNTGRFKDCPEVWIVSDKQIDSTIEWLETNNRDFKIIYK